MCSTRLPRGLFLCGLRLMPHACPPATLFTTSLFNTFFLFFLSPVSFSFHISPILTVRASVLNAYGVGGLFMSCLR